MRMKSKMSDVYDSLKLDNQICFPLYAISKEIIRQYKPFLDELDLTYTQYITMMVMWEQREISVKDLGQKLYLDSGTLTPVLKTLEKKGYVHRERSTQDERVLIVSVTDKGMTLREDALMVPQKMSTCFPLSIEEAKELYGLLRRMLENMEE